MAAMNKMMNHGTRVMRPPRRARPSVARTAAAVIATAALALLAAAWGGSPSSARPPKPASAFPLAALAASAGISARRTAIHQGDGDVRQR
jgi:hypothetical protein